MKQKRIWVILFALYGALMLWLLFDRVGYEPGLPYWEQVHQQLNLVPFRTLRLFADLLDSGVRSYIRMAVINLGGNVIMFIPLGFLLPRVFEKVNRFWKILLATALVITAVEIIQLFTLVGTCDIDDLILNLIGSAIGYGIHKLI